MTAIATVNFSKTECNTPFTLATDTLSNRPELTEHAAHFTADFFEVIFFSKAQGHVVINHQPIALHDGMVLFVSPHNLQAWHTVPEHTEGRFLIFKEEFAQQFVADACFVYRMLYFYQNDNPHFLPANAEQMQRYAAALNAISHELQHPVADSYNMVVAQFCMLLIELNRQYANCYQLPFSPPRANHAFKFKQLIEENIHRLWRVDDYAQMLRISRISLNKYVMEQYGVTATEMIKSRLLNEVKNELIFTNKSLSEIALQYGFSENSHLARFFKKRTGQTTGEFIAAYQKGNI